jgi:hypothetical protein
MLAAVAMAAPALAESVTVGRFYSAVAQAKQLESKDAASAEANLRSAGFDLPRLAVDKDLTEGDMMAISRVLGVAVTTQRPSQPVSTSQVDTYFSVFADRLRAPAVGIGTRASIDAGGNDQGDDNNDQGRPHSKSKP